MVGEGTVMFVGRRQGDMDLREARAEAEGHTYYTYPLSAINQEVLDQEADGVGGNPGNPLLHLFCHPGLVRVNPDFCLKAGQIWLVVVTGVLRNQKPDVVQGSNQRST